VVLTYKVRPTIEEDQMEAQQAFDVNFNWANEYIVLHESSDENIMVHRNMIRNDEFIIMSNNLLPNSRVIDKLWCSMVEDYHLITHISKIKRYQRENDNFRQFNLNRWSFWMVYKV
jgi:hypothetical protein